jgi:subtilase family serine protease
VPSYRRHLLLLACATACLSCGLFAGQASAAAPPCADLYVENIVVSPTNPVQGMPANISITVHNGGTCSAGGFVTQFRTSLGSPTGPSESISSLAPDESKTLNLPFVFTKAGNYEAVVEVDTGNAVPETNEANNLEIIPITVLPPGINLVLDRFSVAPVAPDPTNSVVEGRAAIATIEVTNTGNVPAGPFVVQWTPYAFAKPLTQSVSGLEPGETTVVTMEFTFPFAGKVHGTALVNSTNSVVETNKLDNSATLETEVQPPLPNLRVAPEGLRVNPAPAGSTSTIEVEVENDGNNPAGDFVVTWKPGPLIPAQSQQVNGLQVGERKTISFSNVYKVAGKYEGKVTLDSTNVIKEVTKADNTAPTVLNVPAATVDLTITEMSIHPTRGINGDFAAATVTQGVPQTLTLTVKNLGNSPSGSFVTSWNPSAFSIIVPGNQTLTQETGPLGPGESRQLTFSFTYPQPGNFRSVADVDAFNNVKETNEANNERILNVTVVPAKIALVFVGPIVISPTTIVALETKATATVTIRNNGPLATGSFVVQLTPQQEGFPQMQFVNGLNVGEERTLVFKNLLYFKSGKYTVTAIIDPFNQVVKTKTPDELTQTVSVEKCAKKFICT